MQMFAHLTRVHLPIVHWILWVLRGCLKLARRDNSDSGKQEEGGEGSPRHGAGQWRFSSGSAGPHGPKPCLVTWDPYLPWSLKVRFLSSSPVAGQTCVAPSLRQEVGSGLSLHRLPAPTFSRRATPRMHWIHQILGTGGPEACPCRILCECTPILPE